MTRVLLLGASGAIGRFVCRHWSAELGELVCASRQPRAGWLQLELGLPPPRSLERFDVVVSTGPLDAAAGWLAQLGRAPSRVVAFSSTSVHTKGGSPDPAERQLVERLAAAEAGVTAWAAGRDVALTLLRPTLVYGGDGDRSLARILALARRWRVFPLPRGRLGLRQPVHAEDLALAAIRAVGGGKAVEGAFDLPGAEAVDYAEMVRRVLAADSPPARILRLPSVLFVGLHRVVRMLGGLGDAGPGVIARLRQDLVFDGAPAARALGFAPRPFQPGGAGDGAAG